MTKYSEIIRKLYRSLVWVAFSILMALTAPANAQSCPTLDSAPANRPRFKQGNKVYYQFHSSVPSTGTQRSQIRTAFNTWHSANQINCSKVAFIEGTAPSGFGYATLIIKDLIINTNYISTGGGAADFDASGGVNSLNEIVFAEISFNHDLRVSPSDLRKLYDPTLTGYSTAFTKQAMHEIGHGMGMNHITANPCDHPLKGSSVMFTACDFNDAGGAISLAVASCDTSKINGLYICPTPTPRPTPPDLCDPDWPEIEVVDPDQPEKMMPDPSCCDPNERMMCVFGGGTWIDSGCTCVSPIAIDIDGNGFDLTDAANGVMFDIANEGTPRKISWTSAGSDDAWLALDRNENGRIDKGRELFGSSSPQPRLQPGEFKNGFRALAVFDRLNRGGNDDGRINPQDEIYDRLLLWQDVNHNGFSEPEELHGLRSLGLRSIDLEYTEHRRQDEHGNWFRFRSKVRDFNDAQLGRWAWDVFLDVEGANKNLVSLIPKEIKTLSIKGAGCRAIRL